MVNHDEVLKKIFDAGILEPVELANVERGLKMIEAVDMVLNECLGVSKNPVFDMKYQVGQYFGIKKHKHYIEEEKDGEYNRRYVDKAGLVQFFNSYGLGEAGINDLIKGANEYKRIFFTNNITIGLAEE